MSILAWEAVARGLGGSRRCPQIIYSTLQGDLTAVGRACGAVLGAVWGWAVGGYWGATCGCWGCFVVW